jgi:hypothetical protein
MLIDSSSEPRREDGASFATHRRRRLEAWQPRSAYSLRSAPAVPQVEADRSIAVAGGDEHTGGDMERLSWIEITIWRWGGGE